MTDFKIGDRVRIDDDYAHHPGQFATVIAPAASQMRGETTVEIDGADIHGGWFVSTHALTLVTPSVFARETIVVSFGPDDEHELTTDEANALIRALELAVA